MKKKIIHGSFLLDTKKAIAFLILPYFFPATNIKQKCGKKSYKASKIEVQEKFVAHFKVRSKHVFWYDIQYGMTYNTKIHIKIKLTFVYFFIIDIGRK